MTQLNTPYPATAYLTGFLRQHAAGLNLEVAQAAAALELFLRVFSRAGLQRVLDELQARAAALADEAEAEDDPEADAACPADPDDPDDAMPPSIAGFLANGERCIATVDAAVRFLQGRDPGLAL